MVAVVGAEVGAAVVGGTVVGARVVSVPSPVAGHRPGDEERRQPDHDQGEQADHDPADRGPPLLLLGLGVAGGPVGRDRPEHRRRVGAAVAGDGLGGGGRVHQRGGVHRLAVAEPLQVVVHLGGRLVAVVGQLGHRLQA